MIRLKDYPNEKGNVHCPKCGYKFTHYPSNQGKVTGSAAGIFGGAVLGSKIGLALGPLGAIAGTIPGAIFGGLFGSNIGSNFDKARCPSCGTNFEIPENLR